MKDTDIFEIVSGFERPPVKFFESEADKCLNRWRDYINEHVSIEDEHLKKQISVLLDNQRLISEQHGEVFTQASFALTLEVFSNTILPKLISIQALTGPTGLVFHQCDSTTVKSTARKLKACYSGHFPIDILSDEIRLEIEMEVFHDLMRNAHTHHFEHFETAKGIKDTLINVITSSHIEPNWIVMSETMAKKLFPEEEYVCNGFCITKYPCQFEGLDIYVGKLVGSRIIVGRQGDDFTDTGYVYSPYVFLVPTPTVLDPESFMPRRSFVTRYAKRLVDSKYYYAISCTGI